MTVTIAVDIFEQPEIDSHLARWGLTVVRQNMVHMGLADYFWVGQGGVRYTLERKGAREFIGTMHQRLDTQLRKHSQNADYVGVVIQGLMTPKREGGVDFWQRSKDGRFFHQYGNSKIGYETVQAYIWSLAQLGFQTFQFPDLASMALGISSFVYNSLKPSHSTLQHHTKHKPVLWKPDPYIETLMGIGGDTRIGEKLAERILEECGTPYSFFNSDLQRMQKVIGREAFIRAMKGIGKRSF